MANFRLSTDLFSPIQSDMSLTDGSDFSLGSLAATPDFVKGPKALGNRNVDSTIDEFKKTASTECATTLNMLLNIKKQSNINVEREEKFKDTYEQLKQSMDDLLYSKASTSSIPSPILKNAEFEKMCSSDDSKSIHNKEKQSSAEDTNFISFTPEMSQKTRTKKYESTPELPIAKTHQGKKVKNIPQSKNVAKISGKKVSLDSEIGGVKNREKGDNLKSRHTGTFTSSKKCESLGRDSLNTMIKGKAENLQCAASIPEVNIENKGMSIEKSIEIAVGVEFDKLRSFMLYQNICVHKEMLTLQENARLQNEATEYLFSVIEDLLEANKTLILKYS